MLTKQEREEIKKRFDECSELDLSNMYKCLFGKDVSSGTSWAQDFNEMVNRIFELYDVSNMLELPVDKDGEYIHIGDVVCESDGEEYKVTGYKKYYDTETIILRTCTRPFEVYRFAENLTHKKPVAIKSIAERLRVVLDDDGDLMTTDGFNNLSRIIAELESLGNNDE
jgi:hypothetical protein